MISKLKDHLRKYPWIVKLVYLIRYMNWRNFFLKRSGLPDDFCFNSTFIHTNNLFTQKYWKHLHRGYDDESFIKDSVQKIRHYTMCSYDALANLSAIVCYLEEGQVSGAFVETGVCQGGSSALMAISSLKWGKSRRHLHLFDSFEGLPMPIKEKDYCDWMERDWRIKEKDCDGQLVSSGALIATKANAEEVLFSIAQYPRELATFHVGWFQNTVPPAAASIGPIALLRLDGDLYESTLVCLRHLYPLVIRGGFIIIDDWGLKGCRTACEEYFKEIGIRPYIHFVDGTVRYFIKE
jgi:O-methyltransferase